MKRALPGRVHFGRSGLVLLLLLALAACADPPSEAPSLDSIRVATWNIEDIRSAAVRSGEDPRLVEAAKVIQRLDADILLVNELAYDLPAVTGDDSRAPGSNAAIFVENYLARVWEEELAPIDYTSWMPETNTGEASGFDLDNDGRIVREHPPVAAADSLGTPPRQTADERAYGNDAWGFGTFPGQYGLALFVKPGLNIRVSDIRTFRTFPWSELPGALRPIDPSGTPWYSEDEWAAMRLSSKTHTVIPVEVPGLGTLRVVASHPTPPAFDGEEMRNRLRNHDEIRLIAAILDADPAVRSDQGGPSPISGADAFLVMGDLNADPDEGSGFENPIGRLLEHPRIQGDVVPMAADSTLAWYPQLDADDTAAWGLRVDYVLPSVGLPVAGQGVVRLDPSASITVTDHFPVFLDLEVGRE